jgi:hypothetical protein
MPAPIVTRRALFKSGAALLALLAPPALALPVRTLARSARETGEHTEGADIGASSQPKRPIRAFGRLYDYLKDHELRERETGTLRLDIRNADFTGEDFQDATWRQMRFVDCTFEGASGERHGDYFLHETTGCLFERCTFGARGVASFGRTEATVFQRCRFSTPARGRVNGNSVQKSGFTQYVLP